MLCKMCDPKTELPINKQDIVEHMVITKHKSGHYHIHGPLNNKKELQTMIQILCRETKLELYTKTKSPPITANITVQNDEQVRLESRYSTVENSHYSNRLTMK